MAKTSLVFGATYHGSVPQPLGGLNNLYGKHISADSLRRHLDWFTRKFRIVGLTGLMADIRAGKPAPKNSLFIVFHDGYRDNYEVAFPILKEYGLTASFFLTTSFIGTGNRFWVDVLDAAVKYSGRKQVQVESAGKIEDLSLANEEDRYASALRLRKIFKATPTEQFDTKFDEILLELGFNSRKEIPRLGEHEDCMDWDMVREMADAGMEFGSHTHRHVICGRQSPELARREMIESKELIERELGRKCELFCYPNGYYPKDGNEQTDRIAAEVGYKHTLYMVGPYNLMDSQTYKITGIAYGEGSDERELARTLSPRTFYWRRFKRSVIWPWASNRL